MSARIAAAAAAGFLLGIFYTSIAPVSDTSIVIACCVASVLVIVGSRMRYRALSLAAIVVCAAIIGIVRFDAAGVTPDPALAARIDTRIIVNGRVVAEPDVREGSVRLTVDLASTSPRTRILVIVPAFSRVQYGDLISVEGRLRIPESFESGEGRVFNYPMYLAVRNISYQMSYAHIEVLESGGDPLVRAVLHIKQTYLNGLRAVLPEPYAGLAAGITAGDKRSVGTDLSNVFQRVSLVHILVLSGYNITVVLSVCAVLLSRLSRRVRLFAVLAIILFFIVVSGGSASAVRAGAMAFAAGYATLFGRQFIALRALLLIAVLMTVWNPYLLAFDPGFQLSMLATFGLIAFSPSIAAHLSWVPEHYGIREILAATLSTQITVLPLLLYTNGLLSLVALPANLLALIAMPAAMAFSVVAAISGILFGSWGVVFALPALLLLKYIVAVANVFAAAPFAAIIIPAFPPYVLAAAYTVLGAWWLYVRRSSAP